MAEYVLVVDDEPLIRRFAGRALCEEGFGRASVRLSWPSGAS